MRYVPAQSRHGSGVCACLDESGLYLSILVYLLGLNFVFSSSLAFISCFYFSFLQHALAFVFYRSLVRLASLSSLFSLWLWATCRRVRMRSAPRWSCGALPSLAALGSVARRSSVFCVAWICADARVIRSCSMGGLALPYPRPSSLHYRDVQVRFSASGHWPCSSWGGRDGSICRGDRVICQLHQLGPPLCGRPHRRPSPRAPRSGLAGGKSFSGFFPFDIYMI